MASRHQQYEYLIIYRNPKPGIFTSSRGRVIKQTRESADKLVDWAKSRGYDVIIKKRSVSRWVDATK